MPVMLGSLLAAFGGAAAKVALSMVQSWATAEFIEWVFMWAGQRLVDHTETKHDDEWWAEMKKAYDKKKAS